LPVTLHWREGWLAAALVTAVAGASDFIDGYLARRFNATTPRGARLDLLSDKVFIGVILVMLAYYEAIPLWVPLAVIAREVIITCLRLSRPAPELTVDFWGKTKTFVSFFAVGWVILNEAFASGGVLTRLNAGGFLERLLSLAPWVLMASVFLTLASGANYIRKYAVRRVGV
jgi:CDP-diacylglycerol--glycerol-3-phosphate 3-phosphatidyltransferase